MDILGVTKMVPPPPQADQACSWLPPNMYYHNSWSWNPAKYHVLPPFYENFDQPRTAYISARGVAMNRYGYLQGLSREAYFWFYFGCCGKRFCVGNDGVIPSKFHTEHATSSPPGYLVMKYANVCYQTTTFIDMASQCYDCLSQPGFKEFKGQYWKYEWAWQPNELRQFSNINTPLPIILEFIGQPSCEPLVPWGCGHTGIKN